MGETVEFDVAAEIDRAARVARTPNDMLPLEDLVQELWVFYLEQPAFDGYSVAQKQSLLVKRARKILQQERIDYMHFTGTFVYTPDAVRTILANSVWAEVDDIGYDVEGRADVQGAMKSLSIDARRLLYRRFVLGAHQNFTSSQRSIVTRSVDRIARELNSQVRVDAVDATFVNTRGEYHENTNAEGAW